MFRDILVWTLFAACAPKGVVDPLAPQKSALNGVVSSSDDPLFKPNAMLVFGTEWLEERFKGPIEESLKAKTHPVKLRRLLTDLDVTPTIQIDDINISSAENCMSCFLVAAQASGEQHMVMQNDTGRAEYEMTYTASYTAVYQAILVEEAGQWSVVIQPHEDTAWHLGLDLQNLPYDWNSGVGSVFMREVQKIVERPDIGTLHLSTVGFYGVSARQRSRLVATDQGLALEFGLAVPSAVAVTPVDIEDDFGLIVPTETLLGLMQSTTLSAEPFDGGAEIRLNSLSVDMGGFDLGITVWPPKRRPKPSDMRVRGRLFADFSTLRFDLDDVELVGGDGVKLDVEEELADQQILSRSGAELTGLLPTSLGQQPLRVDLSASQLVVTGAL